MSKVSAQVFMNTRSTLALATASISAKIGGGIKKRQNKDIQTARDCWADYKHRKKREIQ